MKYVSLQRTLTDTLDAIRTDFTVIILRVAELIIIHLPQTVRYIISRRQKHKY